MRLLDAAPKPVRWLIGLLAAALAADVVVVLAGAAEEPVLRWLSPVIILGAGLCMAWCAIARRQDRAAVILLALGGLTWGAAEIVYSVIVEQMDERPLVSIADILWIAYYPFTIAGVALLIRSRVGRVPLGYALDAALGVTAAGAVGLLVTAHLVQAAADGPSTFAILVNMVYPAGDLITLLLVIGAVIACRARLSAGWLLLAAAQISSVIADTGYLLGVNEDTWTPNNPLALGWPIGALLLALAVWQPAVARSRAPLAQPRWGALLLSAVFGLTAVALLVIDHFDRLPDSSLLLAGVAVVILIVRLGVVFGQNFDLVDLKHQEAMTDALTGLGNRRRLLADLDLASDEGREPSALVLFDLDGFKRYNDTFGHPAGDELLSRLGGRLDHAVRDLGGVTYRLGGDEFCALVPLRGRASEVIARRGSAAMRERGAGFSVSASWGAWTIPCPGGAEEALRQADRGMYRQKQALRPTAAKQTLDVLMAALRERTPDLGDHVDGVAELATEIAARLGVEGVELENIRLAAVLHDVGKIAIPDAILDKPGPLDDEEWTFMRRHTLIGERILLAAPDLLQGVASLVRSSHERWDGAGYPDRLRGDEIPFGARIVSVCDAFDAMIARRPYSEPMSLTSARAEIERCAGTQFDPRVTEALVQVLEERGRLLADAGDAGRDGAGRTVTA